MVKKQQDLQIEIMFSRSDDLDTIYIIPQDSKSDGLNYAQIVEFKNQYMKDHNIFTDVKMSYLDEDEDILPINEEFFLSYDKLSRVFEGNFVILLSPEIDDIEEKIKDIEQKMQNLQTQIKNVKRIKDAQEDTKQMFLKKHVSMPETIKKQMSEMSSDKIIDIGVLFSEPLVQKRDDTEDIKVLGEPVKYRQEIDRLKRSLYRTSRWNIYLKCCIASVESLAKLMRQKVKILHLICHGSIETEKKTGVQEGVLQFEQVHNIGCMDKIYGRQIPQFLQNVPAQSKPKLVFINACHSELIGDAFLKSGVPFVIVIQSSEKIEDTAAQIFAQKFYNSLFNGVGVKDSFQDAKDSLNRQNRSLNCNICCCIHTTSHQPKCLFKEKCDDIGKEMVHELYHIPSCTCSKRHLNIHQNDCVWAIDTLFAINKQFRVKENDGYRKYTQQELSEFDELYICCCSNQTRKIAHDQTEKFKFKCNYNVNPNQILYQPQFNNDIEAAVFDQTSLELKGNFSRGQKLFGRNLNIFSLINQIKQDTRVILVYGAEGSGKSKVVTRAVSYMYERGYFLHQHKYLDMSNVTNSIDFNFEVIKAFKHKKLDSILEIYAALSSNKMTIVMDNLDSFVRFSYPQFNYELQTMLNKMKQCKIVLILSEKTVQTLGPSILNEKRYYLEPLKKFAAADMFILHAKDYLKDINMREVWKLFQTDSYRVPKTILDMVHFIKRHFSPVTKVSLPIVIEQMTKRDSNKNVNEQFLEQNIDQLQKDNEAFKIFLFLCEFKDGLTELDFNIMSNHQGEQIPEESALIPENWKDIICRLLFYDKQLKSTDIQQGNYYFCDVEKEKDAEFKKVKVKKYIFEYMKKQKKYDNSNMKFNALAYMSIFSMTILKIMRDQYQHHQKIIEYNNISNAGIFQFERQYKFHDFFDEGEYFPDLDENMSKSTRKNNDIDKGIKKLFQKRNSLFKVNSAAVFMHQTNIKELYKTDYVEYYKSLSEEKKKLFRYYFLSLMINVPSNIIVANDDANKQFLKYCIDKSISIIKSLSSEPSKSINMCKIKLYMMKLVNDLEAKQYPDLAVFKPHFQSIERNMNVWKEDSEVRKTIMMDCHLLRLGILQKQMKVNSKSETYSEIIEKSHWFKAVYQTASHEYMGNLILEAKHILLLSQCFFFTRQKAKQNHRGFQKIKLNYKYVKKYQKLKWAVQIFRQNDLKLLEVRTMVKIARMEFSIMKQKGVDASLEDFYKIKSYIAQIRDISNNPNFNIVLKQSQTQLNDLYPKVTNVIQEKTKDFIVFMKSSPLTSPSQNTIINTVKRTHNFKSIIEEVFQESLFDIQSNKNKQVSVRFQILTRTNCTNILKQGCSIVVLTIDAVVKDNQIFLYFEKDELPVEDKIEINQFLKQITLENMKLIIICGNNSEIVGERIQQRNTGNTVIIAASYNSDLSKQQLEKFYEMGYFVYANKTIQKIVFTTFIKYLMEKIVYSKSPVKSQDIDEITLATKELTIYHMMRFSKQTTSQQTQRDIFKVAVFHPLKPKGMMELWFQAGSYHNISSQKSTLNNLKRLTEVFVGRQKVLVQAMEEIISAQKQNRACCINVFGAKFIGKTSFLKELANSLIERGYYKKGIYFLDGKKIEKEFEGNLTEYLEKNKTTIFQITYFNEQTINNTMQMLVIIDDFHMIKQKSQYLDYFFNAILNKNVNIILSTDEKLLPKEIQLFSKKAILLLELKKFSLQEASLLSYTFIPLYDFIQYKDIYKEAFQNMENSKTNIVPQTVIDLFRKLLFEANQEKDVELFNNYKAYMKQHKKFQYSDMNDFMSKNFLQVPENALVKSQRKMTASKRSHYSEMMKLSKKVSGGKMMEK